MESRFARVVWVVSAFQGLATAQASWTQVASTGPAARSLHAMAYDSQRGRTVLFGGWSHNSGTNYNFADTWEWSGSVWVQVATTGPSARYRHTMAHDTQRGRTVLFGGVGVADTWEWNGSAWTQVVTTGPSLRYGHAMAYDSQRGLTVLFGGYGYGSTNTYLGDTWEWNGSAWTQVANTGPSGRYGQALAYDSRRGRTVLFGGFGFNGMGGDTWEWNGTSWIQTANTGPSARSDHAMAYDTQRGVTVLFGGDYSNDDTWEWDGATWATVATTGPTAVACPAMAYDTQRGMTVLFGGTNDGIISFDDTWEWSGGPAGPGTPATASAFGAGCGSPALTLSPDISARPIINATGQVSMTNIPSTLAFVSLGWSRTMVGPFTLPFSLLGYGLPGCYLLQSCEAAAAPVTFTTPGTATYSLPLPNWNGLIGLQLYLQGWANAPGANAGNTIVSNGIEWVIGNS